MRLVNCAICGGWVRPLGGGVCFYREHHEHPELAGRHYHFGCLVLRERGEPTPRRDDFPEGYRPQRRRGQRRDSQKGKLYKAERMVWNQGKMADKIPELRDVQRWVDRITGSAWWASFTSPGTRTAGYATAAKRHPHIEVRDGRGCRQAYGCTDGWIKLPRWARFKAVILHEMAHVIQVERPAHGRQFASIYLALVRRWCGRAEYNSLKAAFKARRVRYGKEQTKQARAGQRWTPEERAAWRTRLEAGKAAKRAAAAAAGGDLTPAGGQGIVG